MTSGTFGRKLRRSMVRVGRCVIFGRVTGKTRIRRIVIIAVMAGNTIIRYYRMRTVQCIIGVVDSKGRWLPTCLCGMTTGAIRRKIQYYVVRISRLVKIGKVTRSTFRRWQILKSGRMAFHTIRCQVSASQRKCRRIMVKDIRCIAGRVTGQTGGAAV